VRSVSAMRLAAATACVCLLGAGTAGCSTTQDKAASQQAKAEHILKARAERQRRHKAARKPHHPPADGPKTGHQGRKSAHRRSGEGER